VESVERVQHDVRNAVDVNPDFRSNNAEQRGWPRVRGGARASSSHIVCRADHLPRRVHVQGEPPTAPTCARTVVVVVVVVVVAAAAAAVDDEDNDDDEEEEDDDIMMMVMMMMLLLWS
jgi:hypothetical protein